MNGRQRVARNLRRLRVELAMSQESLAVDAGVDRTTISYIEGETYNPSLDLLERLAKALGVDVVQLLQLPPFGSEIPAPLKSGRRPK